MSVGTQSRANAVMRTVLLAAFTATGAFVAPVAAGAESSTPAVQTTLSNGMHVIVLPNHLAAVATVVMEYGVGSNDDTMPGIAHATEHMMFRGTASVSATQLAEIGDRMGAEYNAETSNEYTYYYFTVPSQYVGVVLRLEADRMTNALIRDSDWATERKAIEQEIRAQESAPGYAIGVRLNKLFYGDSVLAQPPGGTVESFERMTAADIEHFYRSWYHPNNATLIVAGDVDPAPVMADVARTFNTIAPAPLPNRPAISLPPLPSTTLSGSSGLPISFCALMYRAPGTTDGDYGASLVLNGVLNSERSAIADLSASGTLLIAFAFSTALPESGSSFLAGVPGLGEAPQKALDLLGVALSQYRDAGVPQSLFAAAKLRIVSEAAFAQSSISELAFRWAGAIGNRQPTPDAIYDSVARAGKDDVDRVLRTYYTPQHQVAAILTPASYASPPKIAAGGSVETVRYSPLSSEPLPEWTSAYFNAPLKYPEQTERDSVTRLANGLRLIVRSESSAPVVILKGEVQTSDVYQPQGLEGVDTATERLLDWGTTSYDRKAYQAQLDDSGSEVTLGEGFELRVTSAHFERGIALLADGLMRPAFPPAGFTVVKSALLQAAAATRELPSSQADAAAADALYARGDPRRRRMTLASVQSITLGDVRRWYAAAYRPDLTTIAVVGDISPADAIAAVAKYFGTWKAVGAKPNARSSAVKPPVPKSETITVRVPNATQSRVTLEQPVACRRDDDYVPLLLADTMLSGEGTGSLLFRELRTRDGYVYDVSSDLQTDGDATTFKISYASDPKNVNTAQAAALAVVQRLRTIPLGDADLSEAKAVLLAQRVLPLASYDGIATRLLDQSKEGSLQRVTFWASVASTTPVELRDAMRRCVQPNRFLRIVLEPAS